jgi:colanic acid/amylovoran biosynthesis glycosyltransferase
MNQRPRLLVLASTYPATPDDGTPAFVRDLAQQEAEDFDVVVVVPRVRGAQRRETDGTTAVERFAYFPTRWEDLADGAIIENLRARPSRWLQVLPFMCAEAWAIRSAVRRHRPDVVHVHWIIPQGILAALLVRRTPFLVTTLGGDLYALDAAPLRALKRYVVSRARAVTVMNQEMAQRVVELGAHVEDVQVMPMGADLTAIRAAPPRAHGHTASISLLFVGRLVEKKGLSVLLRALRELDDPTVKLTVVGDGPLRGALEKEAVGLAVTFVGQLGRDGLAQKYSEHDVAIAPSLVAASGDKDGLPVALIEAMGAGCAVVASDLPGLNEAVRPGVEGILVEPGAVDPLASALTSLRDDREMLARLGQAARARAESYSVVAVGLGYRALLKRIARGE